jgi:hypothetical protein
MIVDKSKLCARIRGDIPHRYPVEAIRRKKALCGRENSIFGRLRISGHLHLSKRQS